MDRKVVATALAYKWHEQLTDPDHDCATNRHISFTIIISQKLSADSRMLDPKGQA
ncbi:MAG TPA: hypothetical protein VFU31_15355 [Candidatus Binatia bacterium]|nr:hypothetical protein [Candidatus Binatia bacterium]